MIDQVDDLGDLFSGINRLYTEPRELAAIWLNKAIICGSGKRMRIAPEETVRVKDGALVDVNDDEPATHKVLACFGTLNSQFEMTLIDLHTNEPLQLSL